MYPAHKSSEFPSSWSKNKSVQCHLKALFRYEFTTMTQRGFQRLWAREEEEEGVFCFLWPGDLGQATVLDVSANLNWLTNECGSLKIHKFDSCACNTDSCTWSVTDEEKGLARHPKPLCPFTFQGWGIETCLHKLLRRICVLAVTGLNVLLWYYI